MGVVNNQNSKKNNNRGIFLLIFIYIFFRMISMGKRKMEKMGSKVARSSSLPPPSVKFSLQCSFGSGDFQRGNRLLDVCIPSRVLRTQKCAGTTLFSSI